MSNPAASAVVSTSGIYAIPKLTNSNWVEFKTKSLASLAARGLSRYLNGTIKAPQPLPTSADGTKTYLTDGKTLASETEIEENLLYGTVPNTVMIQVQSKGSVAEIWKAICAIYEAKSNMVHGDT
ncbi:hypothetical protein PAXRUDRAFT_36884 [Paxillus rubicundulus Ve08.2h10]|uniref:Uncharacterized protein n=1 Tax=Paxillus rubicundulus Ve08.2h10 TaxID=930991 RepID=A0A0D0C098_9AGAM|nr:hypothetical protein PAXRUDRAFT_36884 [Paxillus rubicundulus Ve08.2h10]